MAKEPGKPKETKPAARARTGPKSDAAAAGKPLPKPKGVKAK